MLFRPYTLTNSNKPSRNDRHILTQTYLSEQKNAIIPNVQKANAYGACVLNGTG